MKATRIAKLPESRPRAAELLRSTDHRDAGHNDERGPRVRVLAVTEIKGQTLSLSLDRDAVDLPGCFAPLLLWNASGREFGRDNSARNQEVRDLEFKPKKRFIALVSRPLLRSSTIRPPQRTTIRSNIESVD